MAKELAKRSPTRKRKQFANDQIKENKVVAKNGHVGYKKTLVEVKHHYGF